MKFSEYRFVVVGAGFFGATIAEKIASIKQEKVLLIDKKDHIGGNSYSFRDENTEIDIQRYGSHIFHTSYQKVWNYINQFTKFNDYRHQVFALAQNQLYSIPINLHTLSQYYKKNLSPQEARLLIEEQSSTKENSTNLEEKAINLIGKELYELLIRGYTQKQWKRDPKELPASIIERLPVRYNLNTDYFDDTWQGIPLDGYDSLFEKMLANPNIHLTLNTDFEEIRSELTSDQIVIYTGPIDSFFHNCYGSLGWRSLRFEFETLGMQDFQGNSVINYTDIEIPFTRIHEFKHYHPEKNYKTGKTIICREFPNDNTASNDPMYPVNSERDQSLFERYEILASQEKNIIFGGRLGNYRYYDMDDTILAALHLFEKILKEI